MQNPLLYRVPSLMEGWNTAPNGVVSYSSSPSSSFWIHREQQGYVGPRQKTRPEPVHGYFFRRQSLRFRHDYVHVDTAGNRSHGSGDGLAPSTENGILLEPSFTAIDNVLSTKCLDKLTDKIRGDLDVSIDLAEAGKTLKMFKAVDRMVEYTQVFKKKYGLLKMASSAWLEYTYGLKPLAQTVYGLAEENLRVVINKTKHHRARATGVYKPETINFNTVWGNMTLPCQGTLKRSWTIGVDLFDDQFDLARFSSLNPASIAWELMPFSFVVDWMYNIGGYLRNMETMILYSRKFNSGYRTILTAGELTINSVRTSLPGFTYVGDSFAGEASILIIERIALGAYPAPRYPTFLARLGSSRLTSAAALLSQFLEDRYGDKYSRYSAYLKKQRKKGTRRHYNRRSN